MTDDCFDTDSLASVGEALAWRLPDRLDHLAACATCRRALLELAGLRRDLLDVPVADGLGVPRAGSAATLVSPWPASTARAVRARTRLTGALAAGATFVIAAATLALVMGFLGA